MLSILLFIILTVLPLAPVFADEIPATDTISPDVSLPIVEGDNSNEESSATQVLEDEAPPITESSETVVQPEASLIEEAPQTVPVDDVSSGTVIEEPVILDEETASPPSEPVVETDQHEVLQEQTLPDVETSTSTNEIVESEVTPVEGPPVIDEETLPQEEIPTDVLPLPDQVINDEENIVLDEVVSTSTIEAITSEPTTNEALMVSVVSNDDNRFTFSQDECVTVGDGSFYCSNASSTPVAQGANRVFSAPDSEGDKEIYIERESEVTQITDNHDEDDAPFYDELSNTIVWHRLIDGRYQIVSYDLSDEVERQITFDRYNNMQPSSYGTVIVWQGWIGNDWEIMIEESGELTMLTDNTFHDVSPRINGDYVVWQSFENNAWRVKVYDQVTKTTNTIGESDGTSVENPRFVLVYDAKSDNGDIETKGYDLDSGELVPLSATPVQMPDTIPNPDQTGENRALVQPPVQIKSKSETGGEPEPPVGNEPNTQEPIATSTSDIIVTPFVEPIIDTDVLDDATTTLPVDAETELVPGLLIPSFDASSTPIDTSHIEDVIITPYVEMNVNDGDSQEGVALST